MRPFSLLRCVVGADGDADRLRWYCYSDAHETPFVLREVGFFCQDLGTQLKPLIDVRSRCHESLETAVLMYLMVQDWMSTPELRNCPSCGETADAR